MAHRLDPHYSDFGGLDTRSNPLKQNPKTARIGSHNFRWNYEDQLQQREGFQHKTDTGSACEAGLIEYKYKDINTGESKTQILGVAYDGYLRKMRSSFLELTVTPVCVVQYYSFYYNDATSNFELIFLNSSKAQIGLVNVSEVMTLDDLKTAINALAIANFSADIVDEDGTPISSSLLAYLMDVVFEREFLTASVNSLTNPVYYWETILTPDGAPSFVNAIAYQDDPNYEGISYVNAYNAVYITDGGFPFKYDGYSVYRAGMPKNIGGYSAFGAGPYSGTTVTYNAATAGPAASTTGLRFVSYQFCYKDPNGAATFGKINGQGYIPLDAASSLYEEIPLNIIDGSKSAEFYVARLAHGENFPIYSCAPSSTQMISGTGSIVINVKANHNIEVGMFLRLTTRIVTIADFLYYAKVTATTATTITVDCPVALDGVFGTYGVLQDYVLNGFYGPDYLAGVQYYINPLYSASTSTTTDIWGPYIQISTTLTGSSGPPNSGTRYIYTLAGIPHRSDHQYSAITAINDSALTIEVDQFGEDLPRACKYLNLWQNQLVQSGRPYNGDLANDLYASLYSTYSGNNSIWAKYNLYYSESHLCDYQSIYWADPLNEEGFPQSGLFEESFENNFNDAVSGMMPNKDALFVFKERSMAYLTGTLATGSVVKEFLEADVGAACQGVIQEVRGTVVFMDQNLGFWGCVAGRLPTFIGYPIQQYFKENPHKTNIEKFNFKKAKSTNFRTKDQYLCFVPAGIEGDPGSESICFVLDYAATENGFRNCWYAWQDFNAGGGLLATANDELLISQKESGSYRLWKQKFEGNIYNYSDHKSAIEFNYKGAFLTYNAPVIDKDWVRCVINSVAGGFDLTIEQYANFMDLVISDYDLSFPVLSSSKKTVKLEVKAAVPKLSGVSWGFYANTINQKITIDGWEIEFSASFDRGEEKR